MHAHFIFGRMSLQTSRGAESPYVIYSALWLRLIENECFDKLMAKVEKVDHRVKE